MFPQIDMGFAFLILMWLAPKVLQADRWDHTNNPDRFQGDAKSTTQLRKGDSAKRSEVVKSKRGRQRRKSKNCRVSYLNLTNSRTDRKHFKAGDDILVDVTVVCLRTIETGGWQKKNVYLEHISEGGKVKRLEKKLVLLKEGKTQVNFKTKAKIAGTYRFWVGLSDGMLSARVKTTPVAWEQIKTRLH